MKNVKTEIDTKNLADDAWENVNFEDYPDFCDAFISECWIKDGESYREMSSEELDELNDSEKFADWRHERLWEWIH
tara:strand:+ start:99 stop:326 length:228 start_codon:yes stop_codon:yes gene_type:complete